MSPEHDEQMITISLRWIALLGILILGGGMVGGFIASYFLTPVAPLQPFSATPLPAIERVTITESQLVADQVAAARESVLLLSPRAAPQNIVGAGVVLTNDGLIATTAEITSEDMVAQDAAGRTLRTEFVGRDVLFGITYFRLPDSVVVPLPTRDSDPEVGTRLTIVASDPESAVAITQQALVQTYALPGQTAPDGIQRLLKVTPLAEELVPGSPALDDTGNISGVVTDAERGSLLPIRHLLESFGRVTTEQRERSPFVDLGLTLAPGFTTRDGATSFAPAVTAVTPAGAARAAGVLVGDVVVAVNNEDVTWEQPLVGQLDSEHVTLRILRAGEEREFQLQRSEP